MVDTVYNEQIQEALVTLEAIPEEQTDEITLSTGVVLKRKEISPTRIMAIMEMFPDPEIPLVLNPDKGRMERWDGSAEYQALKQANDMKRGMAMVDTILVSGTEVVSIPEGFPKSDENEWIEELELSHIMVKRESAIARKFAWLKYVAAKDQEDLVKIMSFTQGMMGTSEANVAQQLQANFPDN